MVCVPASAVAVREPDPLSARLHGRVVAGAFRPHPCLAGAHAQTLFPVLRPVPQMALRIERLELADGDFMDLGWCEGDPDARPARAGPGPAPLALLLHGLTGGFDSKYARGTARALLSRGWRAAILQFRGAGAEPNRLARSYHHGASGDLREVVQRLREREPDTPLYAVGWSLGGNVLLKYLGEDGARAPLAAGVAVSAPFQLRPCAEKLRTGFARLYQNHMLKGLKRMVARKRAVLPPGFDLARAMGARDFFEFDDFVTAPLNGFRDAEDYYARASSGHYLGGIARPVLAIHALDDPFMVPEVVPDAARLPACMTVEVCARGGHVGFVAAGPGLSPRFWLEERIPEFLEAQRSQSAESRRDAR